ncbi:MAG: hypothetical protein ABI877_20405 [Gemmatimonadaceae bacterium]
MHPLPPYAVAPVIFQFRALAALSGRLALGGQREIALATLMAARLARDTISSSELLIAARRPRATAARTWFSALTLPNPVRVAVLGVVQACEQGNISDLHAALEELVSHVATTCDGASRAELKRLMQQLGSVA